MNRLDDYVMRLSAIGCASFVMQSLHFASDQNREQRGNVLCHWGSFADRWWEPVPRLTRHGPNATRDLKDFANYVATPQSLVSMKYTSATSALRVNIGSYSQGFPTAPPRCRATAPIP